MTGRVWVWRLELVKNDIRLGYAYERRKDGLHIWIHFIVRLHIVRTGHEKVEEIGEEIHKPFVPEATRPRSRVKSFKVRFPRR